MVALISIREANAMAANARAHARTAHPNTMFKDERVNTKDSTDLREQDAQDVTALKMIPATPMPPEHEENVKMQ